MSISGHELVATPVERLKSITQHASEIQVDPKAPLLRYLHSAETMFKMADTHYSSKDFEIALFYYVRYAT